MISVTATTENGETLTSSRDIYAGRYAGVQKCATCHSGSVMPDKVSEWVETGHATKFEVTYGMYGGVRDYCIRCHTVGYDETADNGGFDDAMRAIGWSPDRGSVMEWLKANPVKNTTLQELVTNPTVYRVINVQCENCHGPGGNMHTGAKSFEASVCGQCHSQIREYRKSEHKTPPFEFHTHTAESPSCIPCHSGEGFGLTLKGVEIVLPSRATPSKPANVNPPELLAPVACATCHDPHEVTHPEEGRFGLMSKQLRIIGEVTTPQDFTVDAEESAVCVKCHANKRDVQYLEDFIAGKRTRGAHSNTQSDVFYGKGVITFDQTFTNSPHTSVAEEGCVQCHMYSTIGHGGNEAGGHTWRMVMENGTENIVACMQEGCHAEGTLTTFDRKASADFDGDGTIEGVQTEIEGLLEKLAEVLPKNEQGGVLSYPISTENTNELQRKALWNYWVINNDGSKGVHNTQFSVQVLQETYKHLTGEEAGGAAQAPPTIPHTLEGRDDCTLCHQTGLPGVGEPGGMGLPGSHEGRTSDTCQTCHKTE